MRGVRGERGERVKREIGEWVEEESKGSIRTCAAHPLLEFPHRVWEAQEERRCQILAQIGSG